MIKKPERRFSLPTLFDGNETSMVGATKNDATNNDATGKKVKLRRLSSM